MSQANASARARRAFVSTPGQEQAARPSSLNQTANGVNSSGLTLPQVISIIDNRLVKLESFMKESNGKSLPDYSNAETTMNNDVIDEFNHRFNILVDEIGTLKDIVLKLQSYTMEVNKTLYEERVHVFSDLGEVATELTGEEYGKNDENIIAFTSEREVDSGGYPSEK